MAHQEMDVKHPDYELVTPVSVSRRLPASLGRLLLFAVIIEHTLGKNTQVAAPSDSPVR